MRETEDHINNNIGDYQEINTILRYEEKLDKPDFDDFVDIYPPEEIEEDKERLRKKLEKIERETGEMSEQEKKVHLENKRRATALEIVIADQVYDAEWLGPEAVPSLGSSFDDYFNGADVVVEFEGEEAVFAIDVTSTSNEQEIDNKIGRNKSCLEEKKSAVKYFISQKSDYRGGVKEVIPLVMGVDHINSKEIFSFFAELRCEEKLKREETRERRSSLRERLQESFVKDILLQQIKMQLEMYISSIKDPEINKRCSHFLKKINSAIEEAGGDKTEKSYPDYVFESIQTITKRLSY